MVKNSKGFVTVRELAYLLGVRCKVIDRWVENGELPSPRVITKSASPADNNSLPGTRPPFEICSSVDTRGWPDSELDRLIATGQVLLSGENSGLKVSRRSILKSFSDWLNGYSRLDCRSVFKQADAFRERAKKIREEAKEELLKDFAKWLDGASFNPDLLYERAEAYRRFVGLENLDKRGWESKVTATDS